MRHPKGRKRHPRAINFSELKNKKINIRIPKRPS